MSRKLNLFFTILVFFQVGVTAGASDSTGWHHILANNYPKAKETFLHTLKTDSTDINSLEGMIYLSEIFQDEINYRKYVNSLINNHWQEHAYRLYGSVFSSEEEAVLAKSELSEASKIAARISLASSLGGDNRQFDAEQKAYRKIIHNLNWSLIGPFKNLAGSGFEIPYAVELDDFDPEKVYTNESRMALRWVQPKHRASSGRVFFSHHLSSSYEGNVYYASTFFSTSQDGQVEFRLGRSAPMKIWLDGDLIFEGKDKIGFEYDNEIIKLFLTAGKHRLLVKNAESYAGYDSYMNRTSYSLLDFMDKRDYSQDMFAIRITDNEGKLIPYLIPDANDSESYNHKAADYEPVIRSRFLIDHYKNRLENSPEDWYAYFGLCKAYIKAGLTVEGEEYFARIRKNYPENVLIRYCAAKLFAANGKIEKVYAALGNIDLEKTPVFALLYERLDQVDKDDEDLYLGELDKLRKINPSSYDLMRLYIRHYEKIGEDEKKKDFVREVIRDYPVYEPMLKFYLDDEDKDNTRSLYSSGDKKNTSFRKAKRNIKSEFQISDYETLIRHYKRKEKENKVIALYDEMIAGMPHMTEYREQKAKYLFKEKQYDKALEELNTALEIAPYDADIMELIGDIYKDKEEKENALNYYKRSLIYHAGGYGVHDLKTKIEKLEGFTYLKSLFDSPSFDDILAREDYLDMYGDEESVILMYTKDLVLDQNYQAEMFQKLMIKILTENGARQWTEYDFSRLGDLNYVKVIKQDGTEITPDKAGGSVVFKNLQSGDIIRVEGQSSLPLSSHFDQELTHTHYVSFQAPLYYTRFEVAIPEGQHLSYLHHKLSDNLVKTSHDGYDFYRWEYDHLPAIEMEEAIVDHFDLFASIMISTMSDWDKVVEWYQRMTYGKLDATYEVREILDSIITPEMSDKEKIESVYNFLTTRIRYSYVHFLNSRFTPKKPGNTCSAGVGDCKDVATVMITMLRELNIDAWYVLVKTNQYHHLDVLPSLSFDHAIVGYELEGKKHFADLTTNYYPHYVLTENDVNAWALLIKEGEKELFRLPDDRLSPEKNTITIEADAVLHEDRSAWLNIRSIHKGMSAGYMREDFSRLNHDKQKNHILENLGRGTLENVDLQEYRVENLEDISSPLITHYEVKTTGFLDKISGLYILKIPYIDAIRHTPIMSTNKRKNRLDISQICSVEPVQQKINIKFLEGYRLLEVPEDIELSSRFGTYKVTFKETEDGMIVERYNAFTLAVIQPEDFPEFKEYYLQLLESDKTRVAIHKSGSLKP